MLTRTQIFQLTVWVAKNYPFKDVDGFNKIEQRGKHGRVMYMLGRANVTEILADNARHMRGKMLITGTPLTQLMRLKHNVIIVVSARSSVRDEIRKLIQDQVHNDVSLLELEFQPREERQSLFSGHHTESEI